MVRKALVTGCAGFIGSLLVEKLLELGYEVVGIDCFTNYYPKWIKEKNLRNALRNDKFKFLEGDILKMDLDKIVCKVEYVFHEAAQPGVRKSWGKDFDMYVKNNILTTQKILETCKSNKVKLIFASSSSVYGDVEGLPIKEESRLKPVSPYGVTKLACESLCYLYWKNHGLKVVVLRYFTVYGERQRPDMAFHKFIKSMLDDKEIQIYGDGNQTRDFTYVGDVVNATILAANSEEEYNVFNIGGGTRISLRKALKLIEEVVGKEVELKYVEEQRGDMRDTYADIGRARRILGYKPEVRLREGLEREVEWIRSIYGE